jgi:hypothetical protein
VLDALDQAVRDYFTTAKKSRLDEAVLNQSADVEYEKMWDSLDGTAHLHKRSMPVPPNLYSSLILRPMIA